MAIQNVGIYVPIGAGYIHEDLSLKNAVVRASNLVILQYLRRV